MIQLMQGNCLERMKEIPDGSVDLVLCDLPYGVSNCAWDTVIPFDLLWKEYCRIRKPSGAVLLFGTEPFSSTLRLSNIRDYKYDWIWEKSKASGFLNAKHAPLRAYETISVFYRSKPTFHPQYIMGGKPYRKLNVSDGATPVYRKIDKRGVLKESVDGRRYPRNVIRFSNPNNKSVHPTQKPVPLLEYMIRTYTDEGAVVLDNTMGSGSTGVACVNTGRSFIGIELDGHWFDVAKKRIREARG